jgi:hypothetical protein
MSAAGSLRRRVVGVGCVVLLAAMAWPAFNPDEADSLPFSNYPMFARQRSAVSRIDTAIRVDADGTRRALNAYQVGGTDQPVQAFRTVQQAIRTARTPELCSEIARRFASGVTIEVVSEEYDAIAWFDGDREPISREVHASCAAD